MIKALLLDLDGTLLDDDSAIVAGARALFRTHHGRLVDEEFEAFAQRWARISGKHWRRFVAGELSFAGQQRERIREALASGLSDADADQAFAPCLEAYQRAWRCFDDVAPFLQATRHLGKVAVTNGQREQQRAKMVATGLIAYVPDLVTPEDAGAWKPEPGIFRHALQQLGVQADEVMMIGDDYERDIAPAATLGIRTFWVRRGINGLNDALAGLNR